VVFFPGNGCSIDDIGPMGIALAKHRRVTGVSLPGREPVMWPDEPLDFVAELPGIASRVLAQANVTGTHAVIGHSMGAMLALQHARACRDLGLVMPTCLVLIEGFVSLTRHYSIVSRETYKPVSMPADIAEAWRQRNEANKQWNRARPTFFKQFWESQSRHEASGWAGRLGVPILQVLAENKQAGFPDEADVDRWRVLLGMPDIADLEVCLVPDAGHWPMLDQPEFVTRRVTAFLDRCAG
jgi:pimeloyl-ACP methyl ester carboxylesterase